MRPAFLGVNIARSALFASQQQLDITSHNIANASVEGYSRQRLALQAAPDIYGLGPAYPGAVGEGVWSEQIQRLRDGLLDKDYRRQQDDLNQLSTQRQYLERIEYSLGELGETGLQQQFEDFFDAWQELSTRPEDTSLRKVLLGKAETLASSIREFDAQALALQNDVQQDLTATVTRINSISARLAELNPEIIKRSGLGETPADLLDERDRLLDELSGYARIDVQEDNYGAVQVRIDGKAIVVNDRAHAIELNPESDILRGSVPIGIDPLVPLSQGDLIINGVDIIGSGPDLTIASSADYGLLLERINAQSAATGVLASLDPAGQLVLQGLRDGSSYVSLQLTGVGARVTAMSGGDYTLTSRVRLQLSSGTFLNVPGGKLQGLMDVRNQDIPNTLSSLNQISADFIRRVNTIHENAYNLRHQNGQPFFTGTSPADIQVAASLIADPSRLATAATANFPPGDGSQALAIYAMRKEMNFDSRYQALVTDLGTRISAYQQREDQLSLVSQQIDNQRQSVAGVNLDEELANMLQYQRSFNAAARVMSTLDEMLNLVVNGLGA